MRWIVETTVDRVTTWTPARTLAAALAMPVPAAPGLQRIIIAEDIPDADYSPRDIPWLDYGPRIV